MQKICLHPEISQMNHEGAQNELNAPLCLSVSSLTWPWNSDHVVLKLNIRTSASPRREQSDLASGTLTMWF